MYEANSMTPADMAAVMGNRGYNNGGFGFGDGAWWIIILFLFAMNGGWGNGFGTNGMMPWMMGQQNTGNEVQRGFDQQSVMNGINTLNTAVGNGFNNVQTALCNGFAGVNQGVASGFAQAEIAANSRQMSEMNQNFALQTSMMQGFNTLQSAQANCCCENRLATAGLNTQIAQEAAANRAAGAANTQAILDKLCQLELDGVKQNYENRIAGMQQNYENRIAGMQNQLDQSRSDNQSLRFAASQGAQTAQILANNEAQTSALEQYLAPTPRPSYVVQNPNCCGYGFGGCGGYQAAA